MNEMTATTNEVSRNVGMTNEATMAAKQQADAGAQAVSRSIEQIRSVAHRIDQASQNILELATRAEAITSVLDVIKGVAEQTNLLALNAAIVFIMSGFILFDTSRIIHGGETNYIRATVALYLNIYNLFTSILHLLGAFGGDD